MSITKTKALGTAILALAIVLTSCNPQVSNIQMRRGYNAKPVGSSGPPVTNQTLNAPAGVNTTQLPTGKIRITWNSVPGATGYKVYYGDPNDNIMKYYVELSASATSWEDDDALDNGHTYFYQVQAVNAAGGGPLSSVTQQAYTSRPASNPFIGTWVSTLYYDSHHGSGPYFSKTETFSDSTFTFYYHETGDSGSGTYTHSGNTATMYVTSPVSVTWYAEITAPNTLKVSYGDGAYHIFSRH